MAKKLSEVQQKVVEEMRRGARMYAAYPIAFQTIDARLESNNRVLMFVTSGTFLSLLRKGVIGNGRLATNRHNEYFLIEPPAIKD